MSSDLFRGVKIEKKGFRDGQNLNFTSFGAKFLNYWRDIGLFKATV